jgi:7,8-dihydropterin-6-yl-methyl-4-(beta-D-ribofuranosyl)aminobenzene 5'-phosphate synthase
LPIPSCDVPEGCAFRVTCLVDNTAELSSGLWAEHGSAYLVETADAKVLFDTGQSGEVLAHNLTVLDKDLTDLSSIVLSHGHYDHTGGLERVLSMCEGAEFVAHPAVFDDRIARDESGGEEFVGMPFSCQSLASRCHLRLTADPFEVAPGIFTTGQVPRGAGPEPRDPRLQVRDGDRTVIDPLLDDLSLILDTGSGLVVLLGCCHAGLINTLEHITTNFAGEVLATIGGTHLATVESDALYQNVAAMKERYGVQSVFPGHCSGYRGLLAFAEVFGERSQPSKAGLCLTF